MNVSFLIVHYNTPKLLRQTLRGIRRSAPQVQYEVIVVDNNPKLRIKEMFKEEFPEVKIITAEKNVGFAGGMNLAIKEAIGRYLLIFNPDIVLKSGAIEKLVKFLDENQEVGLVGPQLRHPDGSIQLSCYNFMKPRIIAYRRLPLLRKFSGPHQAVNEYLMADWDHAKTREVDYMLGAALMVRRTALDEVGIFDEAFFMYFEDQDFCRRFWEQGWKVVYYPEARMVHYHRRETAQGGFLKQIFNPLTRIQLNSARIYYRKYRHKSNPRQNYVPRS